MVQQSGSRTVVELAEDADDQPVLQAALTAGPVHQFGRQQTSLTDLFRHVVSAASADDDHEGAA